MDDARNYHDLDGVSSLKELIEDLQASGLVNVINNDYYGLQGWYDVREEACSGTVRILMENGRACSREVKYKRTPLY